MAPPNPARNILILFSIFFVAIAIFDNLFKFLVALATAPDLELDLEPPPVIVVVPIPRSQRIMMARASEEALNKRNAKIIAWAILAFCIIIDAIGLFLFRHDIVPAMRQIPVLIRRLISSVKNRYRRLVGAIREKRDRMVDAVVMKVTKMNDKVVCPVMDIIETVVSISESFIVAVAEAAMYDGKVPVPVKESFIEKTHRIWREEDLKHELLKKTDPYYWLRKTSSRAPRRGVPKVSGSHESTSPDPASSSPSELPLPSPLPTSELSPPSMLPTPPSTPPTSVPRLSILQPSNFAKRCMRNINRPLPRPLPRPLLRKAPMDTPKSDC